MLATGDLQLVRVSSQLQTVNVLEVVNQIIFQIEKILKDKKATSVIKH
jgi:hypothetical protein